MIGYILLLGCAGTMAALPPPTTPPSPPPPPPPPPPPSSPPHYVEARQSLMRTVETLNENLFSMAPKIPDLSDPRRHYTELMHVIYTQVGHFHGCIGPLYTDYPWVLNETVADGIKKPQMVLDNFRSYLNKVMGNTSNIRTLIDLQCKGVQARDCDQVIADEVNADKPRYGYESDVLLAAGSAAKIFMGMQPQFISAARNHDTHKYVVEGQERLYDLIMSLVKMNWVVHHIHWKL